LRILQISSASSFGGGERHLVDLTNALAQRGHDLFATLRPNSPLLPQLRIPAGNINTLPLRNALDPQSARALARFVKQQKIDVVHAHMARDYTLAAYATRRSRDTKLIVTRHVLFPLNRLHLRILARATRVIAVSQAVANQLRAQRLVDDKRIEVVPNGIDLNRIAQAGNQFDRLRVLHKLNLPERCVLVGSVGEIRVLKRHDDFIRAAAIVAQEFPETQFVVAGVDTTAGNQTRKQLEELVAQLGLKDRIHLLGWLDDAEELLLTLDVFVSASETESFGLAIAEAMAAGTAVVATETEGAKEVVDDQKTGLLVPIGNVERIAAAIAALVKDKKQRKSIGTRARKAVAENFSLERMVAETERLYLASD
jgi:glycosyltransferase involved in cell wall biosynthesis